MTITETAGAGGKRMVRLGREWTGADVVAAALIRRADVLTTLDPLGIRKPMSDALSDYALPQDMLLVLDAYGTLHLVGMGGFWLARPRETLRRWPARTARVVVSEGKGWFRRLTIADANGTVIVAAPFMESRQKAALGLIERLTG
jgi:hypothetical protein